MAPSPLPFTPRHPAPRALDADGMVRIADDFGHAAALAGATGADVLILDMAHGNLLASFLSPLTNRRDDAFGGSPEGRTRFPLQVFDAVRAAWPGERALAVRLQCSDWARGGLTIDEAVTVARGAARAAAAT